MAAAFNGGALAVALRMLTRPPHPLELSPEEEAVADAEAWADYKAGRVISHEAMKRWLLSWGTENELPPPEVGD